MCEPAVCDRPEAEPGLRQVLLFGRRFEALIEAKEKGYSVTCRAFRHAGKEVGGVFTRWR